MTRASEPARAAGPLRRRRAHRQAATARPAAAGRARSRRRAGDGSRRDGSLRGLLFLGPALLILVALVGYPIVYTIWLSLHSADGSRFVGLDNYVAMFTAAETRRAIINNVVWVVVAPSLVTALGLIFAVLTERVRWATAFKVILFMPMAISFLAAGVTFRLVYDESPDRGVLNAVAVGSARRVRATVALPRRDAARRRAARPERRRSRPRSPCASAGTPVLVPLVGLPPDRMPGPTRAGGGAAGRRDGAARRGLARLHPRRRRRARRRRPDRAGAARRGRARRCAAAQVVGDDDHRRRRPVRASRSHRRRLRVRLPADELHRAVRRGDLARARPSSRRPSSARTSGSGPASPWS